MQHYHRSSIAIALLAATVVLAGLAQAQDVHEFNSIGVEAHAAGSWSDAIDAFESAHALEPDNETIRQNLANTYLSYSTELAHAQDFVGAVDYASRAVETDPESAPPLVQLGAYYIHLGRITEAIYRLEEAIELDQENTDAHYLLGEGYYKDNDVSAALDQWEWVYAVAPERAGLQERLEMALREERVEFDFKGKASRNFSITYTRGLKSQEVREILQILESAYRDIGRSLGSQAYPPGPIHVSLYSAEGFSETTQMGDHVGALYDGTKIRCPVFDTEGNLIHKDELRRRLYHEYVHVVVRHIAKDNVPWWLNEGLAETLSHDMTTSEFALLRDANKTGALYDLVALNGDQLELLEGTALDLAYRQSHATVSLLKQRFGTRVFGTFLQRLGDGESYESALRMACRYSYRSLELATANYIEKG